MDNHKAKRRKATYDWDSGSIRALRQHLHQTQREMADELQVRQQTISEWETGLHQPHRSMQKMLSMIAEQAGFAYEVRVEQVEQVREVGATSVAIE